MHSIFVAFTLALLAWNSNALPCAGSGGVGSYDVGIVTCPEQAVVLIQLTEDGDSNEGLTIPENKYPISTENLNSSDHDINGDVVESAANEGLAQTASVNRDPLVAIEAEANLRIAQNENPNLDSSIESAAGGGTVQDASLNQDAVTTDNKGPTQETTLNRDPLVAIEAAEKAKLAQDAATQSESSIQDENQEVPQQSPHNDADEYIVENTATSRCVSE